MTTRELIAGAVALPVVVALTFIEPALALVAGFTVFAAAQKALSSIQRVRPQPQPTSVDTPHQRLAA